MNSQIVAICMFLWCFVLCGVYGDTMHDFNTFRKETRRRCDDPDCTKGYWEAVSESELKAALENVQNQNVAKNVILFLGDGMGISTITASRIYDGQNKGKRGEENFLVFEKFPHVGFSKTYSVDYQVPDSAATGNAFLTGVKTNVGVVGFDGRVQKGDCNSVTNHSIVHSITKWSQDKGKRTGFVTSTRVTHATPANIYAHTPDRNWECDTLMPKDCKNVKDIARQLVEDEPGRNLNVIMGGGFKELGGSTGSPFVKSVQLYNCVRSDSRRLWKDWLDQKRLQGSKAAFVRNRTALREVDLEATEYLMGIFADSHLPYEHTKKEENLNVPTLSEMTEAAIKLLSRGPKGFFLMVEGGRIDHAHHSGLAKTALDETVAMNEAVGKALELTSKQDTLIVVTADHSHTMTIDGYPPRGTPITGIAGVDNSHVSYTTLSYASGRGYNFFVRNGEVRRPNPRFRDTSKWTYQQAATIDRFIETHAGEDVAIYASGPMSHLFHSVHEQNYIPYALAYASCVDAEERHCQTHRKQDSVKVL